MSKSLIKAEYYYKDKRTGVEAGPFPAVIVTEEGCTTEGRAKFLARAKVRDESNDGILEVEFKSGLQVRACTTSLAIAAYGIE